MTDRDSARAAKEHLRTELAPLDGVGGIGIGRRQGGYVVTVDVEAETDTERVPSSWAGVDVEVRVVGRVTPLRVPSDGTRAADGRAADGARPADRLRAADGVRAADGARPDGAGAGGRARSARRQVARSVPTWALVGREEPGAAR